MLVHEEPDERFHLGVGRTKDGAFIVLELRSKITSEVHVIDADRPGSAARLVEPRRQGIEYQVDHHQGTFLLLTNDEAENFRLVATPAADPGRERWSEVIPHRDDVRLEGIDVFARHLVSYERIDGNPRIRVIGLAGDGSPWQAPLVGGTLVPIPETPSASWGGPNPEFASTTLRYEYSSLVTPRSIYDLDMDDGRSVLRKRQPVLGGYDPAAYATERLWATASDGTRVPLSVVYRRDTPLDGTAPCLLYGYGAYEHSIDPVFSSFRLSLLDRGFVFAIAHVRGGGELGRRWYEDGKLLAKPNTFTDFVACARHLDGAGWTRAERTRGPGSLGRGPAHRRRRQPGPRGLQGHGGRGALRRLSDHDARRHPPSDGHRMGGVGQPRRRSRRVRRDEVVQPVRQRPPGPLPGHVGDRRPGGSPRRLLGAGQVGAEATRRRLRRTGCCSRWN